MGWLRDVKAKGVVKSPYPRVESLLIDYRAMDEHGVPSDADLKLWLTATEYQFVERKAKNDRGGWLRTVVAFANSNPIGTPGVLYIGVSDDGNILGLGPKELEDTMKSLGAYIAEHTWPPVPLIPISLTVDGKSCIAAVVPYSSQRPPFAGKAYLRRGTETLDASEKEYDELIATRNGKAREILKWVAKQITFTMLQSDGHNYKPLTLTRPIYVETCGPHFLTIKMEGTMGQVPEIQSYPLHAVELSFDNPKNRLTLLIYKDR